MTIPIEALIETLSEHDPKTPIFVQVAGRPREIAAVSYQDGVAQIHIAYD